MEFLSLSGDVPPHEMSASGNEQGERSVFCRLGNRTVNMSLWFIFLLCAIRVFNKALSTCRWQKLWVRKRQKKLAPVSRALQGPVPQKSFKI